MSDEQDRPMTEFIGISIGSDGPSIQRISGNSGNLMDVISALFGDDQEEQPPAYDFGSAHFDYDVYSDFSAELTDWIVERLREEQDIGIENMKNKVVPVRSVISDLLRSETTLEFGENQIVPHYCTTRCAIDYILRKVAGNGKVALPLPNWHFWLKDGCSSGDDYSFEYFHGRDEDQLIEGFRIAARKSDVKALVLVDPANPMMYRITGECARELDNIALRNGVEIIVDDVLRGNQPVGDRNSIARYFTRPYVVEGFSKRFGERPLGGFSYILLPEDQVEIIDATGATTSAVFGEVLKSAIEYSTDKIDALYAWRNKEFDRVMQEVSPDVKIVRPSDTSIITLLEMPDNFQIDCLRLRNTMWKGFDVVAKVMFDHYPEGDFGFQPHTSDAKLMRVAVGMMESSVLTYGTMLLGSGINAVCKNGLR